MKLEIYYCIVSKIIIYFCFQIYLLKSNKSEIKTLSSFPHRICLLNPFKIVVWLPDKLLHLILLYIFDINNYTYNILLVFRRSFTSFAPATIHIKMKNMSFLEHLSNLCSIQKLLKTLWEKFKKLQMYLKTLKRYTISQVSTKKRKNTLKKVSR